MIAFHSDASNLVSGDANNASDVFVHDRQSRATTRVSVATDRQNGLTSRVSVDDGGAQANGESLRPSITADGRFVAFYSEASTLVGGDSNGASDVP